MADALVFGGTRFIGRHLVNELLAHDHTVTLFNRGVHENPFASQSRVSHIQGDRTDPDALEQATAAAPDLVFDCIAYHPDDLELTLDRFSDVDGYVYISSGAAYGREEIPKREDETPLESYDPPVDREDPATYGARKAQGDRLIEQAAQDGVNAMSIRPPIVYGPYDYTERLAFWIDRVRRFEQVLIPGDGTNVWHRAYVEDVARASRIVATRGTPGEAYNVGDRRIPTLQELLELIADILDTDLDVITADPAELVQAGIDPEAYPLYRSYPHLLSTAKLTDLGWSPTPRETALERTIEEHRAAERTGRENGPSRTQEVQSLSQL